MAPHPPHSAVGSPNLERPSITVEMVLTPEMIDVITAHVAELLEIRPACEPWLDVAGAAEYLACARSRIYALTSTRPARIPHRKDGSRLLFGASELDAWLHDGGGIRP